VTSTDWQEAKIDEQPRLVTGKQARLMSITALQTKLERSQNW